MEPENSKSIEFRNRVRPKMFNSGATGDVCFLVGAKAKFYAHRAFLSMYSDVFQRMFYGGFKKKNEVEVLDQDPDG